MVCDAPGVACLGAGLLGTCLHAAVYQICKHDSQTPDTCQRMAATAGLVWRWSALGQEPLAAGACAAALPDLDGVRAGCRVDVRCGEGRVGSDLGAGLLGAGLQTGLGDQG